MSIYVASSWRNTRQPEVVTLLRKCDHDVYDFRHPAEGDDGFHWSEVCDKEDLKDPTLFRDRILLHPKAKKGFESDMNALMAASTVVLVLPCGRSAHLELGWAVGAGKRTVVLLDTPLSEPELMYKMVTTLCTDLHELVQACDHFEFKNRKPATVRAEVHARGYQTNKTWSLVDTDNYGGDYPNEQFYAKGIPHEHTAHQLADAYNARAGEHSPRYLTVVEHVEVVYQLKPGFEP